MLKKCIKCESLKEESEFHFRNKKDKVRRNTCKDCRNENRRILRNQPLNKYKSYRYDALRRGLKFKLSFSEFKSFEGKSCHYCGDELDSICLDRIDNDLGYFKENIVSCCYKCNSIKHIYDREEFLRHIEKIFIYQQKVKYGKQKNLSQGTG